jgi:preprotein translocase subunit SecE
MPPGGQRTSPARFVRESWAELRKVQWPTARHVGQGTLVVAIVTVFFAIYLWGIDQVMVRLVSWLDGLITG